jgi:hypothetical protein
MEFNIIRGSTIVIVAGAMFNYRGRPTLMLQSSAKWVTSALTSDIVVQPSSNRCRQSGSPENWNCAWILARLNPEQTLGDESNIELDVGSRECHVSMSEWVTPSISEAVPPISPILATKNHCNFQKERSERHKSSSLPKLAM